MASSVIETTGTVRQDGNLELDRKVTAAPGKVKVRLESVDLLAPETETLLEFIDRTQLELEAAGHKFMNEAEVNAWIQELRAGNDRIEEIYRQIVTCRSRITCQL